MVGRGAGSYIMLGSAPSDPSFSVSPLVKLSVAGCGGVGKGRPCVLIPDLVVIAKVGASGSRVSLLLIAKRIWEYHYYDRTLEGKDHFKCLLQTSIPALTGCSAHIHQPYGILHSNRKSGCIAFEMEETFMDGDGLSHISSCHYAAFPLRGKWKNLNLDVSLVALSACVGSLALVLLEEDASSSKRFLPAIARDSF
ncbi:hypothetical protein Tco_1016716 [Tanacetum coccineum]|uniref:Uncharacterized protein n=1 Tax=Tanacetum coccineum TaxID=301880 RepID=A0ABQ5FPJ0_9ASTR